MQNVYPLPLLLSRKNMLETTSKCKKPIEARVALTRAISEVKIIKEMRKLWAIVSSHSLELTYILFVNL